MRNLIVVAFLEPVSEGMEFPRGAWPLHITVVKFDVVDRLAPDVVDRLAPDVVSFAPDVVDQLATDVAARGPADPLAARVAGLMDASVRAALGSTVTVGGMAGFGRGGSVPVSLIESSAELQRLHEALVGVVESLQGRISTPAYTMAGYRPHVSHRGAKGPQSGEQLPLDRIALVDMAPDGGHASRRVLRLWSPYSE